MESIRGLEEVLAVFEMGHQIRTAGNSETPLITAAYDELSGYHFGDQASIRRIWSAACVEYDRRHMSEDEFAAQYGTDAI